MNKQICALSLGAALLASVFALDAQAQTKKTKSTKATKVEKPAAKTAETPASQDHTDHTGHNHGAEGQAPAGKGSIKFIKDVPGTAAALGSIVQGHITVIDPQGKLVQSSRSQGKSVMFKLQAPQFANDLNEQLGKMSSGDSALITIPTDEMMKGVPDEQRPPMFPKGSNVVFGVQLENVLTAEAFDAAQTKRLMDYATAKGLKPTTLPNGLMYGITKPGKGPNVKVKDVASVHYTGKLLNDTIFDSSIPRNSPYPVTVGTRSVIQGWDEGLQMFNNGAKGYLLIPYQLGYGEQGSPPKIMPFDPLFFEIEITDVKPAAPPAPPAAPAIPAPAK